MSPAEQNVRAKRARAVIRAIERELWRQGNKTGVIVGQMDPDGRLIVRGWVDLPMLAWATEQALLREIYPDARAMGKEPICEPL